MWFKNLTLYRLAADGAGTPESWTEVLAAGALQPCGPFDPERFGFVSPYGPDATPLCFASGDALLLGLGIEQRVLPAAVIKEALRRRLKEYADKLGRRPGQRVRAQLKDAVQAELLPQAFVRRSEVRAYFDFELGLLAVDTTSERSGERLISQLRTVQPGFSCVPLQAEGSITATLSEWLRAHQAQAGFSLGDECALRDPSDPAAVVRIRRHDLSADEVRDHVRAGKVVFELGLQFDQRIGLVIDEKLRLRKLRFLDVVQEELAESAAESEAAELEAAFVLMALELRRLLKALNEVWRVL